jgi:hypothetical protein
MGGAGTAERCSGCRGLGISTPAFDEPPWPDRAPISSLTQLTLSIHSMRQLFLIPFR